MAEKEAKVIEQDEKNDENQAEQILSEESDEQVQELSEAEIAVAALEEAEKPPVAAVAEQRAQKQEAQAEVDTLKNQMATQIATLTGQVNALLQLKGPEQKPVEKSPVALYIEENGANVPIDGATYQAQQQWEKDQVAAQQQVSAAEVAASSKEMVAAAQQEFSAEKLGAGMDFETIVGTGQTFLSDADKQAVAQAPPAERCKVLYDKSVAALISSPLVKSLITSIAAGTKENADKGGQQEAGEGKVEETPTQEAILDEAVETEVTVNATVANAMGSLQK